MYPKTSMFIHQLIEDKLLPGASFGFIKNDERFDYRDGLTAVVPYAETIQEDQIYDIASLTKVFLTTTIILQLWEEGKLNPK